MSGLSSYLFSTLSKVGGIGGSGIPDFHYTIGAPVDAYSGQSIWQLHHGQKTDSSKQAASVFVFDKSRGSSFTTAAQNALKRMRTLRHPGILRYMEGAETADAIYIATEPVTPLSLVAESDDSDEELRRWGLYKIAETLKFLSVDCKMVHANLCAATVFVTKAGEWRLGGLELVDALTGDGQQIYRNFTGVVPGYAARMAPEFETRKWDAVEAAKPGAVDGWSLACLIYEVFNGSLQNASQMDVHGRIPQNLWPLYQRLHQPDIRRRMTPGDFLQTASRPGAYLDSEFVHASLFLENIAVKEQEEKSKFFAGLHTLIGGFPQTFSKYKILPELLKVMEFGGGDAKVLSGIIHIGKGLDETEYAELVVPSIVQLFGSNDRALRFSLLEHMDSFIPSVPASVVGKQVFPNFIAGYLDAAPAIREATVKASLVVAPKISSKVLNNDMIRQLVRLIGDPEPGIRTNTLICIGKLCTAKEGVLDLDAGGVNENSHRYAICPALLHALRDSFPPVRSAALAVASACANRWDAVEIARKVIPSLSPLLIDSERQVRMAALKALQAMISRVETHSQTMPATATPAKSPSAADSSNASSASAATGASSPSSSSSSSSSGRAQAVAADMAAASMAAASGWGGWAVSSLSSTFSGALSLAASSPPSTAEPTASQPLSISAPLSQPSPLSRAQSPSAVAASNNSAAAARNSPLSASPSLAKSSQTEKKPTSSGWGFNEDDDDDNGNDNDGWGIDDVDAWDNDDFAAASSAAVASNKPVAGMAMTSTLTPAPLKSSTLSLSKPAASKMLSANRTSVSASQTLTTGSRRKGLGAMKLGGGAKKPTILDDDFL